MITQIFTYFFLCEIVADLIVYGALFNGPSSHLRQGLVLLELVCTLLIIANQAFSFSDLTYLNSVRALRAFSLAKVVFETASVHSIVASLVQSIPSVLNLLLIELVLLLAVATVCVRFFMGGFFGCDLSNVPRSIR